MVGVGAAAAPSPCVTTIVKLMEGHDNCLLGQKLTGSTSRICVDASDPGLNTQPAPVVATPERGESTPGESVEGILSVGQLACFDDFGIASFMATLKIEEKKGSAPTMMRFETSYRRASSSSTE